MPRYVENVVAMLAVVGIICTEGASVPDSSDAAAEDLLQCFNKGFKLALPDFNSSLTGTTDSRLYLQRVWLPQAGRPTANRPQLPITLVTHVTSQRLSHLKTQCQFWQGPLAAAVYLPLHQPAGEALDELNQRRVTQAEARLTAFHQGLDTGQACQLSIMLVWQGFQDAVSAEMLYPYNLVRNAAMLLVQTELIAMIDVDLVPNMLLQQDLLSNPSRLAELGQRARQKEVFVLPAFYARNCVKARQMSAVQLVLLTVQGSKQVLTEQYNAPGRCLVRFGGRNELVHGPTNYTRFFTTDKPYQVQVQRGYEPYFIANRFALPPYDVRFKGYGLDKCVYTRHLGFSNFTFTVLPDAWVVHLPHASSRSALHFLKRPDSVIRTDMIRIGFEAYAAMERGEYSPPEDGAFESCRAVLPWWAGEQPADWWWPRQRGGSSATMDVM